MRGWGVENSDGGAAQIPNTNIGFRAKVWARRIYNITLGDVAAGELIKGSQKYIDPIAYMYIYIRTRNMCVSMDREG